MVVYIIDVNQGGNLLKTTLSPRVYERFKEDEKENISL